MGIEFIIKSDHQSLKHLFSQPLIFDRHIKWVAFIQSFQSILQYHLGKKNVVADALSHKPQLYHLSTVQSVSFTSKLDTYAQGEMRFSSILGCKCHNLIHIHFLIT